MYRTRLVLFCSCRLFLSTLNARDHVLDLSPLVPIRIAIFRVLVYVATLVAIQLAEWYVRCNANGTRSCLKIVAMVYDFLDVALPTVSLVLLFLMIRQMHTESEIGIVWLWMTEWMAIRLGVLGSRIAYLLANVVLTVPFPLVKTPSKDTTSTKKCRLTRNLPAMLFL